MIAFIIILAVLLLIFSLFLFPVKLIADIGDKRNIRIKYLFFNIPLKKGETKKKKSKTQSAKPKIAQKHKEDKAKTDFSDIIEYINIFKEIIIRLSDILRHLKITNLSVDINVSGSDAAQTAISYGAVCSAVYPAVSFITTKIETEKNQVNIKPDYDEGKTKAFLFAELKILPLHLMSVLISVIKYLVKIKTSK